MDKVEIETTHSKLSFSNPPSAAVRYTPVVRFVPLRRPTDEPRRMEFSAGTDHAELAGTYESKQDLRDLLRQLLAKLEAE